MPTRFTRVGPLPCQFFLDAQYAESLISRRDPFPLLPVDLSDATSQPFVCFQGEFRHRRTSKVPNPPIYVCLELSSKGVEALSPTPRSQFLELTQAFVTELLVRPISHDRLPVSLSLNPESKTKGFDVGGADWANLRLVPVDLQERECQDFCVWGGYSRGSPTRLPFVFEMQYARPDAIAGAKVEGPARSAGGSSLAPAIARREAAGALAREV